MKTIFQCENSTDGIFSGIYEGWASRLGHEHIKLQVHGEMNRELFAVYETVKTDPLKAFKVARTLRKRLTEDDFLHLYQATLSKDLEKADSIYRVVVLALKGKDRRGVMQDLENPFVCHTFQMSRNAGNEGHHYLGFVRFRELQNQVLFAEIHPENYVLPLLGDHFSNRFPQEHFLIYYSTHQQFLVHEAHKQWALAEGEQLNREAAENISGQEEYFQKLWQNFCTTIAVRERENRKLQKQMLPLKYRAYMPENFS